MRVRGLLTLLIGLLLTVGCTHDSDIDNVGGSTDDGIATMTIDAILPNFAGTTRAVDSALGGTVNVDFKGDGHADGYVLRIIAKAYGTGDNANDIADEDVYFITERSKLTASIKLNLEVTAGREYKVYLWADYVKEYGDGMGVDLHYNTENLPLVTIKGEYGLNDESRDALYGVIDWEATGNKALTATLTRPLAKLRMMATDADTKADKVEITYDGTLYNTLNIATGEASTTDNNTTHTLTAATLNYTDGDDGDQLKTNQTVLVDYLIVPKDGMDIGIRASFLDGSDNEINALDPITGVKLKRGNLTTLRGVMFESGWDGTTLVEPMTIDGDWLVLNNAKELAWVLETGNTKEKNKIRITSDMDMGGHAVNPFPVYVSDFDGNNKSITNIVVNGNSLFTIDKALSIHDLNVDTITVGDAETVGHVGVLLDEVKLADGDNVIYSNVTISNASVSTTNGAAGGLIGYIGRADEKNRDVTYTVTIENCELTDVTAAGSLSEGHLVGLFSGYDSGETLIFKDNNTIANANTRVDDYVSHYTSAQQSCWLAAVDAKYDGMLGNEVYHRGTVYFGDQLFVPKWDGTTKVEPLTEDGALAIYSAFDMAKLPDIEATSVKMMADVDMGNGSIATLKNSIMAFDGNNKSIHNIAINGNALLAKSDVAVQNLTIDGATIGTETTTGNVGVLFSEIRATGAVSISDITVRNATLKTTNGCAGGIVGYVGRTTENARNTSLTATFTNCHGENITGTQDAHVGQLVGQFGGYDMNEKLVFTNCTSKPATGYTSIYRADQQSCWRTAVGSTAYDGILGAEKYYRGTIMFGDIQFSPKWDGKTKVEPIWEDTKKMVAQIWSPFDLAYVGGTSLTTIRFKSDVDMCGVCDDCRNGNGNATIASEDSLTTCTKCKPFNAIVSLNNLYGENHTLYNLYVQGIHEVGGSYNDGWAFIRHTNTGTFENFTFDGAIIKCVYDARYKNDKDKGGNAYAGTLTSRVAAKMTINNVHAKNGHIIGISKFGGLIGYVPGGITAKGCTVDNYIIENHKINVINSYSVSVEKTFLGMELKAECAEDFYTEGEAGGFIGFISSNASITDCHTSNITMKCYGCEDRDTKIYTYRKNWRGNWTRTYLDIDYTIAGRHINTFIGDIRTPSSNTVIIQECTTSGTFAAGYDYDITKAGKGELVGCCYFVGKDIEVLGKSMHAGDYKGTVTIDGESMPFVGG